MRKKYRIVTEKRDRKYQYAAATVCVILICLLFCGALYCYSLRIRKTTENQARTTLRDTASGNARILAYEISNKMTLFQRIATQYQAVESEEEKKEKLKKLEPLLELYDFKDVGTVTADGEALSVRNGSINLSDAEFFQKSMQGEVGITDTIEDRTDGGRINIYSAPVSCGDTISGVFYAVYDNAKFTSLFFSPFEGNGYSYVVNRSGDVQISENNWYGNVPDLLNHYSGSNGEAAEKIAADLMDGRSGSVTYKAEGEKYAYYSPLGINDWSVVTIVPVSAVMGQYQPIFLETRGFCLVIGGLVLTGAGFFLLQQRRQNRRLKYYAYVDPLTGGKNNTRFILDAAAVLGEKREEKAAVLAVDVNRFKMINQMLGLEAGNRVICGIENVLRRHLRSRELEGHRGADRFIVLWLYEKEEELKQRLDTLCADLEGLSGSMENVSFHMAVGVYLVPEENNGRITIDENYMEQLCGNALMAAQALKGGHTTTYRIWDDEMKNRQIQNKIFEDEMYPALERHEFVPWFQPKTDLKTGKICGAEALVRWQKEDGTLIPPGRFIPFFETNGFIEKVDNAMLEAVCRWQKAWKEQGIRTLPVSVNLSRKYLYSESFARECREYLETYGLKVDDIRFEITETVAAKDKELLKRTIHALHTEGFKVLLDDFGTGYSSLLALQELEFDILKLDCKFIWGIGEERTEKILNHVIAMAKSLEMETIAEGVETEAQYRYLKEQGVDLVQGYYCYRPMPGEQYEQLLRQERQQEEKDRE